MLYTSPLNWKTACAEMDVKVGDNIALIAYRAKRKITANNVCHRYTGDYLNEMQTIKAKLIHDFLRDIFTQNVGIGTEYLYDISESIAKSLYDLPPELQDAWLYPSVAERGSYNCCFRPKKAKDCLELLGVLIGKMSVSGNDEFLDTQIIATSDNKKQFKHTIKGDIDFPHIFKNFQKLSKNT